jgi:hypothetical protein
MMMLFNLSGRFWRRSLIVAGTANLATFAAYNHWWSLAAAGVCFVTWGMTAAEVRR